MTKFHIVSHTRHERSPSMIREPSATPDDICLAAGAGARFPATLRRHRQPLVIEPSSKPAFIKILALPLTRISRCRATATLLDKLYAISARWRGERSHGPKRPQLPPCRKECHWRHAQKCELPVLVSADAAMRGADGMRTFCRQAPENAAAAEHIGTYRRFTISAARPSDDTLRVGVDI